MHVQIITEMLRNRIIGLEMKKKKSVKRVLLGYDIKHKKYVSGYHQ